jgi:hypothetical protein
MRVFIGSGTKEITLMAARAQANRDECAHFATAVAILPLVLPDCLLLQPHRSVVLVAARSSKPRRRLMSEVTVPLKRRFRLVLVKPCNM